MPTISDFFLNIRLQSRYSLRCIIYGQKVFGIYQKQGLRQFRNSNAFYFQNFLEIIMDNLGSFPVPPA